MIRVVTCDDEPLALERLDQMLGRCADVVIVASCIDAEEAALRIVELQPDIAFIDIEMPRLDGFDIVERLPKNDHAALVVFVTAYSNFAAQAFETGALDFLPKPVRQSRLEATLDRARSALSDREAGSRLVELQRTIEAMRAERSQQASEPGHIWIQRRGETVRIDLGQVELIRAEGEYVRLTVGAVTYLHRELIGVIERRLDQSMFLRIHRSTIIRCDKVRSIRRSVHGGSLVKLSTGEELPIGRKYAKASKAILLGKGAVGGSDTPEPAVSVASMEQKHSDGSHFRRV